MEQVTRRTLTGLSMLTVILLSLAGCRTESADPATPVQPTAEPTVATSRTAEVTVEPTVLPSATATSSSIVASPVPTRSPTSEPMVYIVRSGDTLSEIAGTYDVTVDSIMAASGITSVLIYPGQTLTVSMETAFTSPVATPSATAKPGTAVAAAPRLPPIEKSFVTHGDRSIPNVALTFDACQTAERPAGYDAAIIDILTETETPATLFLGGLWMQSHPTQTRALAAHPLFELGNHSWSHPDFAKISAEEMSAEILQTQDIMYELTGRQPRLFRLPFGTYTDEALAVIAQHGLRTIQWDVVTGDPDPNVSADDMVDAVTSQAQSGSIVIMHMNGRGWHTAEALPRMIDGLSAAGFNFMTVSELLGLESSPPGSDENG